MDCETCNDFLLDLHYGELDEARAAEVRAHVAGCAECRAANERLTRTRALTSRLALPDAPAHSAAVMAALAATVPVAAAASGRVSAVIPIERAREVRKSGWLQRVGELAMRRQVAMVAISLLTLGLGLSYLPFRSPTQAVTTETSQPEVIPATELAAPVAAAPTAIAPAQATASTMRAHAPALRLQQATEGRVAARTANAEAVRGASGGAAADSPRGTGSNGQVARPDNGLAEAEVAPTPAPMQPPVAAAATTPGGYYRNAAPVAADDERQMQQAMPAAPAPLPPNWETARNSGDNASARGDSASTIAGYQRALELDPPAAQRRAIAQSLYRALINAGRGEEASRVQAQYLTTASDPSAVAGQVTPSMPHSQTAAGLAHPSAPRSAAPRPARRSISNVNNDFNQSGY